MVRNVSKSAGLGQFGLGAGAGAGAAAKGGGAKSMLLDLPLSHLERHRKWKYT